MSTNLHNVNLEFGEYDFEEANSYQFKTEKINSEDVIPSKDNRDFVYKCDMEPVSKINKNAETAEENIKNEPEDEKLGGSVEHSFQYHSNAESSSNSDFIKNENPVKSAIEDYLEIAMIPKRESLDIKLEEDMIEDYLLGSENECKICNKPFLTKASLTRHYTDIHKQVWSFKCGFCDKSYPRESDLKIHEKKHTTGSINFVCKICLQDQVSQRALTIHMKNVHIKEKEYSCEFCNKMFAEVNEKIVHERRHMGVKPYMCDICNKFFTTSSALKCHISDIHEKNGPYKCGYCDKSYYNESALIDHERKHTGLKPFTCETCGKSYDRKSTLNKHVKIHEPKSEDADDKHFCEICFKMFARKRNLKEHIRFVHEEGNNFCEICNKSYAKKDSLERHIKDIHEARDRPLYECQSCHATFREERSLQTHVKVVHEKERNFICNICSKAFGRRDGLRKHVIDVHENSGKHGCDFCDKKFRLLVDKQIHERKHTKEKPFQCMYCGIKVGRKSTLAAHVRLKHPQTSEDEHQAVSNDHEKQNTYGGANSSQVSPTLPWNPWIESSEEFQKNSYLSTIENHETT